MKVSRVMEAPAGVIKLADRVQRLEGSVADMAPAFREDSKTSDKDFVEHGRRI